MKKLLFIIGFISITLHIQAQKKEIFGEKITEQGFVNGEEFLKRLGTKDSLEVKIKAPITSVCQKKGCWMHVDLGNDKSMMVRFKDYGFFVPKDAEGDEVLMQGKAFKETLTVEMLRHYAEDAGKSKEEIMSITEPQEKLSFEASGVIVYRKKKK
ncbi:MAG: DUF4920 domain-containing protein [Flavobacteriales bacterium]